MSGLAFKHLREKIRGIRIEISDYHHQAEEISRELHYPIAKWPRLSELNLGIDIKGQIKDALHHDVRLTTNLEEINARINELEKEVEKTETICTQIEKQLISESEFKTLQEEMKQHEEAEELLHEKAELEEKAATFI